MSFSVIEMKQDSIHCYSIYIICSKVSPECFYDAKPNSSPANSICTHMVYCVIGPLPVVKHRYTSYCLVQWENTLFVCISKYDCCTYTLQRHISQKLNHASMRRAWHCLFLEIGLPRQRIHDTLNFQHLSRKLLSWGIIGELREDAKFTAVYTHVSRIKEKRYR